jgi:hypothetical protein
MHASLFGHQRCLILTVTTSPQRVVGLIEANHVFNSGRGSGLFLFIDKGVVERTTNLLDEEMQNGRAETVTLMRY